MSYRNIDVEDPELAAWVRQQVANPTLPQTFTTSTLPPADENQGRLYFVSDGAGNRPIVVSDGTIWRYADGLAV